MKKIGRKGMKSKIETGRKRNGLKNNLSGRSGLSMMTWERRTLVMGSKGISKDMVERKNLTRGEGGGRDILGDPIGKGIMKSNAVD